MVRHRMQHYDREAGLKIIGIKLDLSFWDSEDDFPSKSQEQERTEFIRSWFDGRMEEIGRAEETYKKELETARVEGRIAPVDYMKAMQYLQAPDNLFEKTKRQAREILFRRDFNYKE